MYALWLAGPIVERWYGRVRFLAFYLACAAGGSVASFVFGGDVPGGRARPARSSGCSASCWPAGRLHHPVDRQSRALVGQLGMLILINLVFGLASGGRIDNAAHLGGLVAGLWLGALILPSGVPTLSSLWHRPAGRGRVCARPARELAGIHGRDRRRGRRARRRGRGGARDGRSPNRSGVDASSAVTVAVDAAPGDLTAPRGSSAQQR